MSHLEQLEIACLNMVETYMALALTKAETGHYNDEGVMGCMNPNRHPVCNFSFAVRPSVDAAVRLRDLAMLTPGYTVYLLPCLERPAHQEILERAGFRLSNQLIVMNYPADGKPGSSSIEFDKVEGFDARYEFASFVARLFFENAAPDFIDGLASVTAAEHGFDLLAVNRARGLIGGAMCSRQTGSLGIYNVAVTTRLRNRGTGAAIVQALIHTGLKENRLVTLQCHEPLVEWYEHQGFRRVESVLIYRLP